MNHRVLTFSLFILYIALMSALMIWQGIGIAPDRYAFVLLLASILVKRTRSFILDWIPFLFILLSYDFLRGLAPQLNQRVNYQSLIDIEQAVFGFIPTIELQKLFYHPSLTWLDYVASVLYFLHFALPLSLGFILWFYNRSHFRIFITGILLLSYAAWVTFIIYPAAPPWLASENGYLPNVHKVMDQTLSIFPNRWDLPTIYHQFNPNPVAAIPSLHAAYPLLVFLFALKFFKLRALPFLLYVFAVWFSIVYLGEHYVIDVIAGAIYAIVFFLIAQRMHLVNWDKLLGGIFKAVQS